MESSDSLSEYMLVTYPGIVRNSEKAVHNLGGIDHVSKCYYTNSCLELNPNRGDAYSKGIYSTLSSASKEERLLLVVKAQRCKKPKNSTEAQVQARIVGHINKMHEFKSMADFQYLPVQKTDAGVEDILPKLFPSDISSALDWWTNEQDDTPLFLPPHTFSRYSNPSPYVLMKDIQHSSQAAKVKAEATMGQSNRIERKALTVTVNQWDAFPSAPTNQAVAEADSRCQSDVPHKVVENLFEQRPLWTRNAIIAKTQLEYNLLKNLLQKYAFYILSGPWGRLWCRFGYDPRVEPSAKRYQTVMVHLRQNARIPEKIRLKVQREKDGQYSTYANPNMDNTWRYICGQLPAIRQCWYSLCDIDLPIAKQYLESSHHSTATVDPVYGWLPQEAQDLIRSAVREDVANILKEMDEIEDQQIMMEEDTVDSDDQITVDS